MISIPKTIFGIFLEFVSFYKKGSENRLIKNHETNPNPNPLMLDIF
jgi:hypothetical protein